VAKAIPKKKTIYYGFSSNEKRFVVDYLCETHQWEPVLFLGSSEDTKSWREKTYSDVMVLEPMKLRQGDFDYSNIGKAVPVDAEILYNLSKYSLNFLGSLEDSSGWNYSYIERKQYYYEILKYWNTLIQTLKPDLIVFSTWPHTPSCYSLYLLCKYHYTMGVLFLDPVPLLNQHYHMIGTSLEELFTPIMEAYDKNDEFELSEETQQNLDGIRSNRGLAPQYIIDAQRRNSVNIPRFRIKQFVQLLILTLLRGTGFRKANVAWKKNRKPFYTLGSRMSNLEYFLFVEFLRNKNKMLLNHYILLCVEPDFNRKYIYFAAQYQPEATTDTNAGVFENLFRALDILSNILPEDWVIYYKENPTTFHNGISCKGALRRDKYYFQQLNAYPNVQLVSNETDTFKLIENAQAVSSVSGTAAWEAIVRGKPALSFGSAWYMGCKSIFRINTLQDAKDAMGKIVNGWMPHQADIERYVAAIEKVAVKGMIHYNFHESIKKCKDPKYEMERIAKALYEAYERHYKK
jgi:hypothetical protein